MTGADLRPTVVVVGSYDTKREPLAILAGALEAEGCIVHRVDFGVAEHETECETTPARLAELAGSTLERLRGAGRGAALDSMARGVALRLGELRAAGDLDAVVYAGGSGAGTVFGASAPAVPFGVPKVLVSTIVAGDTRGYLHGLDALLFYPVVDIEGDNEILRSVLTRSALATAALARGAVSEEDQLPLHRRRVALTMFGITTPAVTSVRRLLEADGAAVTAFHANGTGGAALEAFLAEGRFDAVVDLTTTELADLVGGGTLSAGEGRLSAAAAAGIPQVVVPGALDVINFGGPATLPESMRSRRVHRHNDNVTLVRTDPGDNATLGALVAQRLNRAPATSVVVLPLGGFSDLDSPGMPFWWPEADSAFADALQSELDPGVRCVESELHVNAAEFAELLVAELALLCAAP